MSLFPPGRGNASSHDAPPTAQRAAHPQAPHRHTQPTQPPYRLTPHPRAERPRAEPPGALGVAAWPVIRQSAALLSRDQDAFIRQLHYDVTSMIPDLADTPALDMWVFCERMAQSLLWAAVTDQPLGVVADTLRRVGAQNWVEGFPDTHYGNIAQALVRTVHYLSESDWSASTGSVWISYFMWIRPHLLAGAQQAAAQHAAEREAVARQMAAQRTAAHHSGADGDVNLEPAASPLDDVDDEDAG